MSKKLLIVESPAKAKTIGKYLGADFVVKSSVGHIRDLPTESSAIKITSTGENRWNFRPTYVVSNGKEKVVVELKSAVKNASEVYLASDPDREGEAIAWHLKEVLEHNAEGKPFKRVTYNEITKSAVLKAVASPRDIDMPLVDAQQARRILDRIVGYEVSPLLWRNINCPNSRTLSAGRVQSVALRLLVERQREIEAFKPETYFLLGAEACKPGDEKTFVAKLSRFDGKKPEISNRDIANTILLDLAGSRLSVSDLKSQKKVRHALPPFTTSTLQQAASSVLGISPGKTMKLAQELYEQGRITYMRTDSVNVSEQARDAAKSFIVSQYGQEFYPDHPNIFKSKADAQGAHEAIRPTDVLLTPESAKLESAALKLYDLIWRRFLASQMADAQTTLKTVSIVANKDTLAHDYLFTASATIIDFEGFLKVMKLSLKKKKGDSEEDDDTDEVAYLPDVNVGDDLDVVRWLSDEKQTKGPAHYSEASLIKALEENGVGRPSTYAATIETLKTREYAKTEKRKLVPMERGILVCDWLVKKLDMLFNVGYTAQMESELDKVAEQGEPMDQMLSDFYAKFKKAIVECKDPPPEREKFTVVFGMLDEVKSWEPAKKVGKRIYDDHAFVDSVRSQFNDDTRELSAKQLAILVRVVLKYSDQISDVEQRMKDSGLVAGAPTIKRADPTLVKVCFDAMDRIPGLAQNPFLKSLHDQYDAEKPLSIKQFVILAKSIAQNSVNLEDREQIIEVLKPYVGEYVEVHDADPQVAALFKLTEQIAEWRPKAKRGKKVYDDKSFVDSLSEQFSRRHTLSPRQIAALKRVVNMYSDKIPDFKAKVNEFGLDFGNGAGS